MNIHFIQEEQGPERGRKGIRDNAGIRTRSLFLGEKKS